MLRRLPHARFVRVEVAVPTDEELPDDVSRELQRFSDAIVQR